MCLPYRVEKKTVEDAYFEDYIPLEGGTKPTFTPDEWRRIRSAWKSNDGTRTRGLPEDLRRNMQVVMWGAIAFPVQVVYDEWGGHYECYDIRIPYENLQTLTLAGFRELVWEQCGDRFMPFGWRPDELRFKMFP